MAKHFNIPRTYRSDFIGQIKSKRAALDPRKTDFSPTEISLGNVTFLVARFFGFCYGVENAIEIAYRALEENPGKRIFLLSEMIHNPHVNHDLLSRGVSFLQTAEGEELIPISELNPDDIVIIPAFGTTQEIVSELCSIGISPQTYNATCPFVEKVWKRGRQIGAQGFSVVIHGKHTHEETRATFSQVRSSAPSVVVRDHKEAMLLARYVRGEMPREQFYEDFLDRYSEGFDAEKDLERLGVINQTTMLAEETHGIAQLLKDALITRYGQENIERHFADTRDTLCYATSENQRAMKGLLECEADMAVIVGGYNSSNTSHLVELCEGRMRAYYVKDANEILSSETIRHLDLKRGVVETSGWLPSKESTRILVSAGASCPDAMVEAVLSRIASFFPNSQSLDSAGIA